MGKKSHIKGIMDGVYINRKINEFLDMDYPTTADFYAARYEMLNQPFTSINIGSRDQIIVMYTSNPTIVSGGTFARLDTQEGEEWLWAIESSDQDLILIKYFIDDRRVTEKYRKRIAVVRRLNYYKNLKYDKYIKVDMDYGAMARHLAGMKYIARQQAELLALHSQINPHFLFNVLESIRMHSIIKREDETAGMIERLAVLQRQNVDWSDDHVRIKDELKFVEAYLDLQKYRFGDKLSYQISIKNGCENYYLPKLTLETFVENACVHGAENKAGATHIYVRVYEQDDSLFMEVEDTGEGMSEEEAESLNARLKEVSIDDLKTDRHVGMINACLRLKMLTNNRAFVRIESEKGVGTTIFIGIPLDTLKVAV